MDSNPDREVFSARFCINLIFTRVSGVYRSSTYFPYPESFSAPLGAIKCLSFTSLEDGGKGVEALRKVCIDALNALDAHGLRTLLNHRVSFAMNCSRSAGLNNCTCCSKTSQWGGDSSGSGSRSNCEIASSIARRFS